MCVLLMHFPVCVLISLHMHAKMLHMHVYIHTLRFRFIDNIANQLTEKGVPECKHAKTLHIFMCT
jgi:hypothetical protein